MEESTMEGRGTSVFQKGLVWFGAAVSIAEIEAGAALAPAAVGGRGGTVLGAILLGHLFGGAMLFLVMLLGARTRRSGMDCAKLPFGRAGGGLFAALNLLQLVGWTAVMVAQGAGAAGELLGGRVPFAAVCAGIGLLVAAWIYIGLGGVSRINTVAMALLFALTLLLFVSLFATDAKGTGHPIEPMPDPVFWFAFEMSVAMPLSWLPLAADYTKDARRPVAACAVAALVYSLVSCWMYGIGMLAATYGSISDAFRHFGAAGLGAAALLVIVFSTVTTTFLDAYSAGESAKSIWSRIPAKPFGVAVCALGTLLAALGAMDRYLDFLYLIASVFAPMAAVLLVDWVGGGAQRPRTPRLEARCPGTPKLEARCPSTPGKYAINLVSWLVGLAVYHLSLRYGSPVGATLPAMAASAAIAARFGNARRQALERLESLEPLEPLESLEPLEPLE